MAGKIATRAELTEAVYQMSGLSRHEAALLVEQVNTEIGDALAPGESVNQSGFGMLTVGDKAARVGRKPKTGIEVPISLTARSPRDLRKRSKSM